MRVPADIIDAIDRIAALLERTDQDLTRFHDRLEEINIALAAQVDGVNANVERLRRLSSSSSRRP
jgi:ABC-type transporter Mla subunit MlaD